MRAYPALRLTFFESPTQDRLDHLLAQLDDFHPTAIDDVPNGVTAYFTSPEARDAAATHFGAFELLDVASEEVPDEDWAERSQASLTPVTVGRLTIAPPWAVTDALRATAPGPIIVIEPSMGFGTGHHATTRLCLDLLQRVQLAGKRVLDIGTGSGVLAIAARRLGASQVMGVDIDPDALANARDNLQFNPAAAGVAFEQLDLSTVKYGLDVGYDIVLANLTGAMLERYAGQISVLAAWPGEAHLIISGFLVDEAPSVLAAFQEWTVVEELIEAPWVAARLQR